MGSLTAIFEAQEMYCVQFFGLVKLLDNSCTNCVAIGAHPVYLFLSAMSVSVCSQASLPLPMRVQMARPELLKCVEERVKVKGPPQDYRGRALSADEYAEILWSSKKHTSTMRQCAEVRYVCFWQNSWLSD